MLKVVPIHVYALLGMLKHFNSDAADSVRDVFHDFIQGLWIVGVHFLV